VLTDSFGTVWVSRPTLNERAAGAAEMCLKL